MANRRNLSNVKLNELLEELGDDTNLEELSAGNFYQKVHQLAENKVYRFHGFDIEFQKVPDKHGLMNYQIGKGVFKKAFNVVIRSGPHEGKRALLIINVGDHVQEIFENQWVAFYAGLAPEPYTYTKKYDGIILIDYVKGDNICDIELSEDQQLGLLRTVLELHKHRLYQGDPNCGNYYVHENRVYVIDDLTVDYKTTLLTVLKSISYIQRLHRKTLDPETGNLIYYPLKLITRFLYNQNKDYISNEVRTSPIQELSEAEKARIGGDFYVRAMTLIREYDVYDLLWTVQYPRNPRTRFRLSDGFTYEYLRADSEVSMVCKRLEDDSEVVLPHSELLNVPIHGISRGGLVGGRRRRVTRRRIHGRLSLRKR